MTGICNLGALVQEVTNLLLPLAKSPVSPIRWWGASKSLIRLLQGLPNHSRIHLFRGSPGPHHNQHQLARSTATLVSGTNIRPSDTRIRLLLILQYSTNLVNTCFRPDYRVPYTRLLIAHTNPDNPPITHHPSSPGLLAQRSIVSQAKTDSRWCTVE